LTHLRLRLTAFGDEGVNDIIESGILKRLRVLDLRSGRVSDAGAQALAVCPDAKRLEELDLSRNELTEKGIDALAAAGIPARTEYQHSSTGEKGPTREKDVEDPEDFCELEFMNEADYE
jgi:Ran GTPase-activating protein (RanGAP) involved in mRNA processing and transport